ncbi:MAG: SPFH domain-containing protein [Dactylosporangium sp.]|nr:SPFH domain-containing protein [Dactylosporangium sp.]
MEKKAFRLPGFPVVGILLVIAIAASGLLAGSLSGQPEPDPAVLVTFVVAALVIAVAVTGFTVLNPNESQVIQFFGRYVGTIHAAGFHWTVPLTSKKRVSQRVRNFETARLKVSDADGNPVEIAAVVVWRVQDTAKAVFAVDNYEDFVAVQAEAAVRHLATSYPYEAHDRARASLRDAAVASEELTNEMRERVEIAGLEVLESRLTHLAYAPEIAQAMLARQQANAIVAARYKIVEGAVGMVQNALERLAQDRIVDLDEERKAQMVSNLLVVLCGDRNVQPVVNTGTLYA